MKRDGQKKAANGGFCLKETKVKYKECLQNHAASIGGYAVDGCQEFMATGEEGTAAGFMCAACNCHRNFHRREVEDANCNFGRTSTSTNPK